MFRALALGLLIPANPALAALSGFYDSGAKITAILASEAVGDALRQAPIGAISNIGTTKDGKDIWQVRVQDCDLEVWVVPHLPDGPGMTTYSIEVPGVCE